MHEITFKPAPLAKLLRFSSDWREVRITSEGIHVRTRRSTVTTLFSQITRIRRRYSFPFAKVELITTTEERVILGGIRPKDATLLSSQLREFFKRYASSYLSQCATQIRATRKAIDDVLSTQQYVAASQANRLVEACRQHAFLLNSDLPDEVLGHAEADLDVMSDFFRHSDRLRNAANERFLDVEAESCASLFDRVESLPLTNDQRRAALTAEDNTLVVAGAGSGKTSVIVAKVAYQLHRGLLRPEEILALAFSREAKNELEQRFKRRLGKSIQASTFHALGLGIISQAEARKPDVSVLATDQAKLLRFIQDAIERAYLDDRTLRNKLNRWLNRHFAPYKPASAFKDKVDYWEYLRNQEIRSLSGALVKSYEECEIADFLYLNGVQFEYEAPYERDTFTAERRQYKPDFKIGSSGLYIEHFAINKAGRTPEFIDHEEYTASMEWKRQIHKEYDTGLIETYSWQHADGTLLTALTDALQREGIELCPISPEAELAMLKQLGRVSRLASLAGTFLSHQKSGRLDHTTLVERAKASADQARNLAFLDVYQIVLDAYEGALGSAHEIDFNDMINDAADAVLAGKFKPPWRLILIDEFQDISQSRARLVRALHEQDGESRLFVVGDDWQAIYRFAGADIAVMREFESIFGTQATVELNDTFRFGKTLAEISANFVRKNPVQTQRTIRSSKDARPAVVIIQQSQKVQDPLWAALNDIHRQLGGEEATILVLGRYHRSRPTELDYWRERFPLLEISYRTVHAAKGLEADFVIVVEMVNGKFGFPSEILDDPVLGLVLSAEDRYPNAEERRLFYVALTRARRTAYVLTDADESVFVHELKMADGVCVLEGDGPNGRNCPSCKKGNLVPRQGKFGSFLGCTNYPYCRFTTGEIKRPAGGT